LQTSATHVTRGIASAFDRTHLAARDFLRRVACLSKLIVVVPRFGGRFS
jgi:hypothetical protein